MFHIMFSKRLTDFHDISFKYQIVFPAPWFHLFTWSFFMDIYEKNNHIYHGWEGKSRKPAHFPLQTLLCCHQIYSRKCNAKKDSLANPFLVLSAWLLLTCGHAKISPYLKKKKASSQKTYGSKCATTDLSIFQGNFIWVDKKTSFHKIHQ